MKLENDNMEINMHIEELNSQSNLRTVHWDRDLMKISIKRRGANKQYTKSIMKFVYKDLYDGVHPCQKLRTLWYRILIESISKDLAI